MRKPLVCSIVLGVLTICSCGAPPPPPTPPCSSPESPPFECITLINKDDVKCPRGPIGAFRIAVENKNTRHVGVFRYREQLRGIFPPSETETYVGPAYDSPMIKLEPGKSFDLNCEYVFYSNDRHYLKRYYSFLERSYENLPTPGPPTPIPVIERPVPCSSCGNNEEYCLLGKLVNERPEHRPVILELLNIVAMIRRSSPPMTIGGTNTIPGFPCLGTGLHLERSGRFLIGGGSCVSDVSVGAPAIDYARISYHPKIEGGYELNNGVLTLTYDLGQQPLIEYFKNNRSIGTEHLAQMVLRRGELTLTGSRHYCARVNFPPD